VIRGWGTEGGRRRAEDGTRKTEGRRRNTEDGGQKTEGGVKEGDLTETI